MRQEPVEPHSGRKWCHDRQADLGPDRRRGKRDDLRDMKVRLQIDPVTVPSQQGKVEGAGTNPGRVADLHCPEVIGIDGCDGEIWCHETAKVAHHGGLAFHGDYALARKPRS